MKEESKRGKTCANLPVKPTKSMEASDVSIRCHKTARIPRECVVWHTVEESVVPLGRQHHRLLNGKV